MLFKQFLAIFLSMIIALHSMTPNAQINAQTYQNNQAVGVNSSFIDNNLNFIQKGLAVLFNNEENMFMFNSDGKTGETGETDSVWSLEEEEAYNKCNGYKCNA